MALYILMNLGGFEFRINNVAYNSLTESISAGFAEHSRIAYSPVFQNVGGIKRDITMKGNVVMKPSNTLDSLRDLVIAKKPVRLITGYGKSLGLFILPRLDIDSVDIIDNGASVVRSFTLTMKQVSDE